MARRFGIDKRTGKVIDKTTGKQASKADATKYRERLAKEAARRKERDLEKLSTGKPTRNTRKGKPVKAPSQERVLRAREEVHQRAIRKRKAKEVETRKLNSRREFGRGADLQGKGPLTGHIIQTGPSGSTSEQARRELADKLRAEFKRRGKTSGTVELQGAFLLVSPGSGKGGGAELAQVAKTLRFSGSPEGIAEAMGQVLASSGRGGYLESPGEDASGKKSKSYAAGYLVQGITVREQMEDEDGE